MGRWTAEGGCPYMFLLFLGDFDQLHFVVATTAVQDHQLAFKVAEDKDVAIFEVSFLNCFFESHRAHRDILVGAEEVHFGGLGHGRDTCGP